MLDQAIHDQRGAALRRDQLGRLLRLGTHFSEIVACWAGFGMQAEQTVPARSVGVNERDSRLLGVPDDTKVTRRELHLVSTPGSGFLAAGISELVYEGRLGLGLDARRAVRTGSEPLDHVVHQVRRTVCYLETPSNARQPDDIAVRATTVLLLAGTPVALVTETVFWRLITHRPLNRIPNTDTPGLALVERPS